MDPARPRTAEVTHIWLHTESGQHAQRWSAALRTLPCQLYCGPQPIENVQVDIVVTDRGLPVASDGERGAADDQRAAGVIAIGIDIAADVSLPADATDRELQLACLLLAQIVRLRRDQRESLRVRELLSRQALTDPLTGLPNRRAYDQEIARRILQLPGDSSNLCLALIDLDHFKQINDAHGHSEGDQALKRAGDALLDSVRSHDFVARLGGDEFVILLCNVAIDAVPRVVDRIRAAAAIPPQTASAGFAVLTEPDSAETLFRAADAALLQAKAAGRDRTCQAALTKGQ